MNWIYFDIETLRAAHEVGGWSNIEALGIAVAVTFDSSTEKFGVFRETEVAALGEVLQKADAICGFNSRRFDLRVLQPYVDFDVFALPHLDLMLDLRRELGFSPSLNNCCGATLGEYKSGGGLEALDWWREGREDEVIEYCRQDVQLTARLHQFGAREGSIWIEDKTKKPRSVKVQWTLDALRKPPIQGSLF